MAIFISKEEVVYPKWKYAEKSGKREDEDICLLVHLEIIKAPQENIVCSCC